ncbi:unnamed protein product [Closterium sp. NIES-53]
MAVISPWRHAMLPTVALLLSSVALAVSLQVPEPAAGSSLYVVQLRSAPAVAVYNGGIPGFAGTAAVRNPASHVANAAGRLFSRRPRVNLKMPHVRAFAEMLKRQQRRVARDLGIGARRLLYSYTHVANGFAAELTAGEARRMRRHPAVGSVTRSGRFRLLTTASPAFLQLPPSLWAAAGGQSSAGEDVVVGVVDTGIWPEHKSFANDSSSASFLYDSAPAGWQGSCRKSADFPASACNGKIVGAQVFYAGFKRDSRDRMDFTRDWLSPRDADGHGTWCSGASTGNGNVQTNTLGPISGMAPRARLAMYKVFWKQRGGYMYATYADIFAAVNRAVADGVDVLSLSLGGSDDSATYFDDSTFINVHTAGVVVAFAAGNAGSPWRVGMGYRTLDNFSPWYITVGASTISRFSTMTPAASSSTSSSSSSSSPIKPTETATSPNEAPIVAGFSSTGPLVAPLYNPDTPKPTNDILKPDILAPGVSLWAATAGSSLTDTTSRYARLSGTSMATPHVAGIAALLMQRNPEWTPAQIISAMMTTATVRNNKGSLIRNSNGDIATPWETGAGHVNPMKLLDPGLTYDANETDFRNFLAGQALTRAKKLFKGITLQSIKAYNLNRPSIAVGRLAGTVTVQRRVTNVADAASTYTAAVAGMDGVSVTVKPPSFTIEPGKTAARGSALHPRGRPCGTRASPLPRRDASAGPARRGSCASRRPNGTQALPPHVAMPLRDPRGVDPARRGALPYPASTLWTAAPAPPCSSCCRGPTPPYSSRRRGLPRPAAAAVATLPRPAAAAVAYCPDLQQLSSRTAPPCSSCRRGPAPPCSSCNRGPAPPCSSCRGDPCSGRGPALPLSRPHRRCLRAPALPTTGEHCPTLAATANTAATVVTTATAATAAPAAAAAPGVARCSSRAVFRHPRTALSPQQLREWYAQSRGSLSTARCSAEGACHVCLPPDPGIQSAALGAGEAAALGACTSPAPGAGEAAALGAGESALSGAAPAAVLHTFTLDSGASRSIFRDSTTLTPLSRPVAVSLADPSGGPVLEQSSTVLPGASLQDAWVDQFTPRGQRVTHCTCSRTGRHLATFTRRPGSSPYTLSTAPPPVSASGQVAASSQVFAAASRSSPASTPCSCHPLSHETLLWHHRLGHPSLPRLRGMVSHALVSGLPRSLPPLPPRPAPTCVPCVKGRQRAAPHSSSFPSTEAPLQTLHMDVWGPARVRGQGHERYFLLVVDDYSRYTTVFPLRSKGEVPEVMIDWISGARCQLSESFGSDLPTFTLPASPQQNGIAERRIGMAMDVTRTSMIHAAAPHFLWPFTVQYAAHQISLQPRVSLPETTPTLRWTGKVGDASAFRVWGSRSFVRDNTADKLSSRAVPCVFLGFPPDAPGWQFYHPTSRRVLSFSALASRTPRLSLLLCLPVTRSQLHLRTSPTSGMGLVLGGRARVVLTGHADASWVDDLTTQRSSQGYTFSLGSGSVSWRSTHSSSILSSSCEAEIYAGAMAAQELRWLTYLVTDLGEAPRSPPILYVDNKTKSEAKRNISKH